MTEERKQEILLRDRRCRGPLLISEPELSLLMQRYESICHSEVELVKLKRELEQKHKTYDKPYTNMSELRNRCVEMIYARTDLLLKACNFDVNQYLIEHGIEDGQSHSYDCPQCGTKASYMLLPL